MFKTYDLNSKPYGISYGGWTVEWWQWALSTPRSVNPVVDTTGQNWKVNQPSENVWFLAGKVGETDQKYPNRKVEIQTERSILIPILNCEANSLEYPNLKTHKDLIEHVENDVNTVVKKNCFINGEKIEPVRVPSDPQIFNVTIAKDNAFGVSGGGSTQATADGFWIFLKPLPEGNYVIDLEGSCEYGKLNAGARYELKIL